MITETAIHGSFEAENRSRSHNLESQIGNTPLLGLRRVARELPAGVEIFVKAEHMNPGGSVKDRAALAMILEGERSGRLYPGKFILDATSGNTGIAYAMLGAARGDAVMLCLPRNASEERKRILRIHGAEVIETDPLQGSDGAQTIAREMATRDGTKYFYADQYNNDANWRSHYDGTGREIWEQTQGSVTHFVAGLGTSGTFVGVTRRLHEYNARVRCISVQPAEPWHGLEGLKHMATSIVPGIYDPALADEDVGIDTEPAYAVARELARAEGILAGHSSGAALCAVRDLARRIGQGVIVTVLADGGDRYLSTGLYGSRRT